MNSLRKLIQETLAELTQNPPVAYLFDRCIGEGYMPGGGDVIEVNRFVYHKSAPTFRNSILKNGLETNVGDSYSCFVGEDQADECMPAIFATNSDNKKDWFDSTWDDDIWQIDTAKIDNEWFKDTHYKNSKHIVTFDDIPPDAIKLIYKGTGKTLKEGHYTTWKKLGELGPLQYGENVEEGSPIDQFAGTEHEIAKKLAKHFKIGKIFPLGSGTNGFAYYIPNNRVLKITKDKTEVAEAYKIKGKKLKHLANVYETYELHGKYEGTYVIISELLDRTEDINNGDDWLSAYFEDWVLPVHTRFNSDKFFADYGKGKISKLQIKKYINDMHENMDPHQAQVAEWYMKGMMGVVDELKEYNIHSTDWGVVNLGIKKSGNLAMYDLGYGDDKLPVGIEDINLNEFVEEGYQMSIPSPTNHEYSDFFDGQNNPLFKNRAFPPVVNINDKPLAETEISSEELNKKDLPYKFSHLFDDFVIEKTEAEIREIAPALDLNQNPGMLMMNLETNYPSLFDNFADWLFNKEKNKNSVGSSNV